MPGPGFADNPRPGPGRPKGALNKATQLGRHLAQGYIDDPLFDQMMRTWMAEGTMPAAVATTLLHYAFGKPTDKLIVDDRRGEFRSLSLEELRARALEVVALSRKKDEEE